MKIHFSRMVMLIPDYYKLDKTVIKSQSTDFESYFDRLQ